MARRTFQWRESALALAALGVAVPVAPQAIELQDRPFNEQVLREQGQPVVPVYEGWYEEEDGTKRLCFGYLNANTEESLEIPMGPQNFIEPAPFDGVQPTHFRPVPPRNYRRDYCVFTVTWPEGFGDEDRIRWTLQSRGSPLTAPGHVGAAYELDNFASPGRGDFAPVLRFGSDGPSAEGRTGVQVGPVSARVGVPLQIDVQVEHPLPGSWLLWAKHTGPGDIAFSAHEFRVGEADGKGTTMATFSAPGTYVIRVQAVNSLGSFDFYCCWTNGYLEVTVEQ